ncbi:MAG: DNA primase [Atopobiaceae bacterium]|nr:DNA primase [Atopobiaceae bacterium]
MITDEDKERVRQATDFMQLVSETVELRRRGADWWGCCPFHHEKSPSFHINPATGLWKCFGCGLGGDVFGYVMHRENLEFPDAIRFLADRAGIELVEERGGRRGPKRNRLIECLTEAESFYATMLNRGKGAGPEQGRRYLAGRGFGSAVCRRWRLGYAPGHAMLVDHLASKGFTTQEMEAADLAVRRDSYSGGQGSYEADRFYDRVMFPIHDEQGRTIAFGGRVMGDAKPKYLNTKETAVFHKGKHLFAFDRAKEHIAARGEAIVCEGYTDVMALHEAGYPIAVAALGTSFSIDHVRTLSRFAKRIICMFDGDAAGQRAAERAIQFLDKSEADLRCVVLPDNQDPAEFLDTHRASDLEPILADAEPLMDFVLRKRLEGVGPTTPAGVRTSLLNEIARVLAPLKQSVLLDEYTHVVGDWLGFPAQTVRRAIQSAPVDAAGGAYAGARPSSPARGGNPANRGRPNAQGWSDGQARYPEETGVYVPDDYLPPEAGADAYGSVEPSRGQVYSAGPGPDVLGVDELRQVQAERELLCLMATYPDLMRTHAERIASILWADAQNEAIAWSILATPEGTAPADVVAAASAVVPDAPQVLAAGRIASESGASDEAKAAFVLDTVELYSTRRKIQDLRARMRSGANPSQNLFYEATELQKHANELTNRISSGFIR